MKLPLPHELARVDGYTLTFIWRCMNILLLGGSIFLGRHIAIAALNNGHSVTFFNRGHHFPDDFPEIEKIRGDRATDLHLLHGRTWDVVIDTCGYFPRIVSTSAQFFADKAKRYVFISSVSVYAGEHGHLDENSDVMRIEDPTVETITGETYGALKYLCELAAEYYMPERVLTIRPGLIVGPNDWSGRFNYWVHRMNQGGNVLVPNASELITQFIDVRDLAEWTIRMVENTMTGIYNADGDTSRTFGDVIETCMRAAQREINLVPVSEHFLIEHGVQPYTELPLWIPPEFGSRTFDSSKANATGLTYRSINDTVESTAHWLSTISPIEKALGKSLTPEREAELLRIWSHSWQ